MSFRAKSCKATVRLVATMEDGTKRQLFAILDVHVVEQYIDPGHGDKTFMKILGEVTDGGGWIEGINVHSN